MKVKNINQLHYKLQVRTVEGTKDADLLRHFSDLKLAAVTDDKHRPHQQSLFALHKWATDKRVANFDRSVHLMMVYM